MASAVMEPSSASPNPVYETLTPGLRYNRDATTSDTVFVRSDDASLAATGPWGGHEDRFEDYHRHHHGAAHRQAPDWTSERDTAICVDGSGRRIADQSCGRGGSGGHVAHWFYLGRGARVPYYGEAPTGGSYSATPGRFYTAAPAGSSMTRSAAISRGGFGSIARGFGGFHGFGG